jgi:hypothetical protein
MKKHNKNGGTFFSTEDQVSRVFIADYKKTILYIHSELSGLLTVVYTIDKSMIVHLVLYFILVIIAVANLINNDEEPLNQHIPFCIKSIPMKEYLIIFIFI